MKPFSYMRLKKLSDINEPPKNMTTDQLVVEQKFDGFKILATKNRKIHLYTRRGQEVTNRLDAMAANVSKLLPKDSTVLGEMVYEIAGDQDIYAIQKIIGSSPVIAKRKIKNQGGKVVFYIYDVLQWRGQDLRGEPLFVRLEILDRINTRPSRNIRKSRRYAWEERRSAIRDALSIGAEGIVIKDLNSVYRYKKLGETEPTGRWWKYKPPAKAKETDVILKSYREGKKKIIFRAYQKSGKKLINVGNLSGIDLKTEKKIKRLIDSGKSVVAEVSYQEKTPAGKLRHMGWKRLRPDKPVSSVTKNPLLKNPRLSKGYEPSDFDKSALREGTKVEMEHTDSKKVAQRIAMDHLVEDPNYYVKLRAIEGKPGPYHLEKNPRPSKVKGALAAEAASYPDFDRFAKNYWENCARGIYWFGLEKKEFDQATARDLIKKGRMIVSCTPKIAFERNKKAKYVAELDLTNLANKDFAVSKGSQGTRIRLKPGSASKIKIMRLLNKDHAAKAAYWMRGILPSSKDELRDLWEKARKKAEEEAEKAEEKAKKRAKKRARKKNPAYKQEVRMVQPHVHERYG